MYGRRNNLPFGILLVLAIVSGMLFYWWDRGQYLEIPASANAAVQETEEALQPEIDPAVAAVPTMAIGIPTVRPTQLPAPGRAEIPPDTTLFIPNIAIYSDIIEAYLNGQSWDISELHQRVGHLEGTAWIDRPGNVVLSGHVELSDGRPGIFARIGDLALEDIIMVESEGVQHIYHVTSVYRTTPDDLQPLQPTTSAHRLTLITCGTYDWLSDRYDERVIVVAERI
ncbi:MAG: sortase [Anaerolineae bacterium]|nr:sortase [Anaerolineae bacterium]